MTKKKVKIMHGIFKNDTKNNLKSLHGNCMVSAKNT